jgi:thiol-disulfide isomerase/thioredoxin
MDAVFLSDKFGGGLKYDAYVQSGTAEQQRRWKQVYDSTRLNDEQVKLVGGFTRQINVLVVSGIWCGDCVQQCPLLQKIAEANPGKIDLRLVDRDAQRDLAEQIRINAGDRVPMAIFMAEDFELCSIYGDRTIHRYRALALKQLGASCPIAIGPPDQGELAETLGDWLTEVERVHLMLRLSARLRGKHGD